MIYKMLLRGCSRNIPGFRLRLSLQVCYILELGIPNMKTISERCSFSLHATECFNTCFLSKFLVAPIRFQIHIDIYRTNHSTNANETIPKIQRVVNLLPSILDLFRLISNQFSLRCISIFYKSFKCIKHIFKHEPLQSCYCSIVPFYFVLQSITCNPYSYNFSVTKNMQYQTISCTLYFILSVVYQFSITIFASLTIHSWFISQVLCCMLYNLISSLVVYIYPLWSQRNR